jgi:carbon monoxide dehydrogenase subunit G
VDLQHRFTVPAPVDVTWQAFNDLEQVAPCFPGASLTSVDGDTFTGTVKIKLGPISMQYSGTGTFLERDEATYTARLEAKGKDKRGNGTASATVLARLLAEGDATAVEVSTDLAITGKPAQFGRGVIQDVSNKLLDRFVACLAETLSGPGEEAAADEPPVREPAPAPTPAAAEPAAASVASARAEEAVAAPQPRPVGSVPAATATSSSRPSGGDDGLDLLRAVAPVLARRLALPVGGALLGLWVLRRLLRR